MGLRIRRLPSVKYQLLATFVAVFALVAQPMYTLVANQIASAAPYGDVIVRAASTQGWNQANVASGGASSFVDDATAPYGQGALQLTTTSNTASKVQRAKSVSSNVKLSDITTLSYWTKQISASNPTHAPSLQLTVNGLTGTSSTTILVFEPYWNTAGFSGVSKNLPNGVWQQWNVKDGVFWSTQTRSAAGLVNGAGGPPFYTLAQVIANNPNAKVTSLAVNIGTYNASHVGLADGVNFNGTVYDFEPAIVAPAAPTIDVPTEGQVITSSPDVTVSWDKPANAETFEYTLDGGVTPISTGTSQSFTQTFANGSYQVQVRAIGSTGLKSGWSAVRNFTVDIDQPPVATIITPVENGYVRTKANSNKLSITGTYTDDRSVNYLTLQLVGASGSVAIETVHPGIGTLGGPFSRDMSVPANIADGAYRLIYTPADYNPTTGGQFGVQNERHFTIDNTRPRVELLSPAVGAINPASYTVKATDNFALKTVTAHIYNASGTTLLKNCSATATPAETDEYELTCPVSSLADGTYTIKYNALDMAGNISETKTSQFVIDNTNPVISVSGYQGNLDAKIFREVSFKLHDATAKIDRAELNGKPFTSNHGSAWGDFNNVWANKGWSGAKEGENTLVLYDMAGNSTSYAFTIDSTAPTGTFAYSHGNNLTNQDATVTLTTSEEVRDIAGWTRTGANTFTKVFTANGDFTVNFSDIAGNAGSADGEVKRIDKVAPVALNVADGASVAASSFVIEVEDPYNNGAHGIADKLTIDGNPVALTRVGTSLVYQATINGPGSHTVVIKDKAGNETTVTFTFTVEPPVSPPSLPLSPPSPSPSPGFVGASPVSIETLPILAANLPNSVTRNTASLFGTTTSLAQNADDDSDDATVNAPSTTTRSNTNFAADNDDGEVQAAEDVRASWSVVNAVLAAIAIIAGLMALLGMFAKKDEGEESRNGLRAVAVALAVAVGVVLAIVEDFGAPMAIANLWTILFAGVALVEAGIIASLKAPRE